MHNPEQARGVVEVTQADRDWLPEDVWQSIPAYMHKSIVHYAARHRLAATSRPADRAEVEHLRACLKAAEHSAKSWQQACEQAEVRSELSSNPCQLTEGMVLVPREPTEAMLEALHKSVRILVDPVEKFCSIRNEREVWTAMLTAALTQGRS